MRDGEKRIGLALLLLLLGACSDAGGSIDGRASFDDDEQDERENDDATSEEDSPSKRAPDAGRRDGGERNPAAPDGGANVKERDASGSTTPDASRSDAASPPADAATDAAQPSNDPIPEGEHCAATANWDPASTAFEDEVLRLTNEARAAGHNCGSEGNFSAAGALTMEPRLRCAARLYSKEMADTNNWGHVSKDGTTFDKRIARTGYVGRALGENIARGQSSPAQVVQGWLKSPGHCANIMSASFTQIGIGYYAESGRDTYWTQNFGTPFR